MNKIKKKLKGFYDEHELTINSVIFGACIGGVCVSSYILGSKMTKYQMKLGLTRVFDRKPELGFELMNTLKEIKENDAKLK